MTKETYGFGEERAAKYDADIVKALPGYLGLHNLVAATLGSHLTSPGPVLVVGAGTGTDITPIAMIENTTSITACEPEQAMAFYGQKKTGASINGKEIQWWVSQLSATPKDKFSAVVMTLVLHFLPDDGAKAALLMEIRERLVLGGTFIFVNLIKPDNKETEALFFKAWESYNALNGVPESEYKMFFRERVHKVNMVSEKRDRELWQEQGFKEISRFTSALFLQGYVLEKI
jgi:tRNA (cmo5U34)-methyltransferase